MVVVACAWVIVSAGRVDIGHAVGCRGLARTTLVTVGTALVMPILFVRVLLQEVNVRLPLRFCWSAAERWLAWPNDQDKVILHGTPEASEARGSAAQPVR